MSKFRMTFLSLIVAGSALLLGSPAAQATPTSCPDRSCAQLEGYYGAYGYSWKWSGYRADLGIQDARSECEFQGRLGISDRQWTQYTCEWHDITPSNYSTPGYFLLYKWGIPA